MSLTHRATYNTVMISALIRLSLQEWWCKLDKTPPHIINPCHLSPEMPDADISTGADSLQLQLSASTLITHSEPPLLTFSPSPSSWLL